MQLPHHRTVPARGIVIGTLGALLTLRILFDVFAGPLPDEAYYWLWGQHLALSYFDHPPLNAWLQRLVSEVAGPNLFGLRLLTWLTTAGIVTLLARCRAWDADKFSLFAAAAVFFASPLVFVFTTVTFPDHLVIFLGLLSACLFVSYFDGFIAGEPRTRTLYAAAVALGLGGLTKYNVVFIGLGVAITVLATPRLRPLLRNPHLYAAAAISCIIQTPVVVWNLTTSLASFQYNLWDRFTWNGWGSATNLGAFLAASAIMLSPFLLDPLVRFLFGTPLSIAATWRTLGRAAYAVSTAAFTALCLIAFVQYYWNLPAYLIFLATAWTAFRFRWAFVGHLVYGVLFAVLFTFNYTVLPWAALIGVSDTESAVVYGWDDIAHRVSAAKAATGAEFLATSDYRTASLLAFATGDHDVVALSEEKHQFDVWVAAAPPLGKSAIILTDDWHPLGPAVTGRFERIEPVATFPVTRFGHELAIYRIYKGIAFKNK